MINILLILVLMAILSPIVRRFFPRHLSGILFIMTFGIFVYFLRYLPIISSGNIYSETFVWIPSLGFNLSFYLDGLSLLFSLLISGIGSLIFLYAGGYLADHPLLGRFYTYLAVFTAAMLGLVLADNIFSLFIFWELTSISSYLLIGFKNENPDARKAALQALLLTGIGGMALLGGFILLVQITGKTELSEMMSMGEIVRAHGFYVPILLLILVGSFTKSAQIPFHFWLPGAMEAPAPVSAFLHSATMVKAGIYLLARLNPLMGGTDEWHYLITFAGGVTMLIGGLLALTQNDLKKLLAYSTISALGTLIMLLGLSTKLATKAAIVFLLVHSLYKASLFMMAGAVDHETGTRDVNSLSGLIKAMPFTALAAGLAALSMSGFPPLLGFISKELLYEAKLQLADSGYLILVMGVIANIINVTIAVTVGIRPFFGSRRKNHVKLQDASFALWFGPVLLAVTGLFLGLFPDILSNSLIAPAMNAVRAQETVIKLKLWHGINPAFILSVFTVLAGISLYAIRPLLQKRVYIFKILKPLYPSEMYKQGLELTLKFAGLQTRLLQNGYLRYYLTIITSLLILLLGYQLHITDFSTLIFPEISFSFWELILCGIMLLSVLLILVTNSRLTALISLGIVGFGMAVIFVIYGAPDLAITQILIETLMVILFVLVIYRLPKFKNYSALPQRIRDAVIATGAGLVMFLLIIKTTAIQFHPSISDYFAKNSLPLGKGKNVVNVILVDFRALDTLAEISVLAIASIGVLTLLRYYRGKENKE